MNTRLMARALAPLRRGMDAMIARAVVAGVTGRKMQAVTVRLLAGETKGEVEHFEPFGFTSHPQNGAEGVAVFPAGDRSHGLLVVIADRRHRPKDLKAGESCVHNAFGIEMRLEEDGTLRIIAPEKVRLETPLLEVTGEVRDRCDSDGITMEGMREAHNAHVHPENDSGGPTNPPTTQI